MSTFKIYFKCVRKEQLIVFWFYLDNITFCYHKTLRKSNHNTYSMLSIFNSAMASFFKCLRYGKYSSLSNWVEGLRDQREHSSTHLLSVYATVFSTIRSALLFIEWVNEKMKIKISIHSFTNRMTPSAILNKMCDQIWNFYTKPTI